MENDRLRTYLKDIANALRTAEDSSLPIYAFDVPQKIASLSGTGSGGDVISSFVVENFPDTDTLYIEGDEIDYSGVTAHATLVNGVQFDIDNASLIFYPEGALTSEHTQVVIAYDLGSQRVVRSKSITVYAEDDIDGIAASAPETLNECSWHAIDVLSRGGRLSDIYPVGSTKTFMLDSTKGFVGRPENEAISAVLIGYGHNKTLESPGHSLAHFMCNYDPVEPRIWTQTDPSIGATAPTSIESFCMNQTETNLGGWKDCTMRTTVLGNMAGYDPTNPLDRSFMATMPSDLRKVMKPAIKYTNNVGGSEDLEENVSSTSDYISLLSPFEIYGVHDNTIQSVYETYKQAQYDFFKIVDYSSMTIMQRPTGSSESSAQWFRSPAVGVVGAFAKTSRAWVLSRYPAQRPYAILPIFFV